MSPSEFAEVLVKLLERLRGSTASALGNHRKLLLAVVNAWFEQYRPTFLSMLGEDSLLTVVDDHMRALLRLAHEGNSPRGTAVRRAQAAKRHFLDHLLIPLSRAYWSRAPERAEQGRDAEVVARLKALDPDLADSYEQVVMDVEDGERLSYRGPANELREVLTTVLHALAPTDGVKAQEWYKDARKNGTRTEPMPTRAERVKFVLRTRGTGEAATDAAETFMSSVEERLAGVVNVTYRRGSAATHVGTERGEVFQLLHYTNALLRELLPEA